MTLKKLATFLAIWAIAGCAAPAAENGERPKFDPKIDLLSLHYDHAPDKDDGHSAAADRTVLQSLHGTAWLKDHVVAVSGAYGENANRYNSKSDAVMDAAWKDAGGWLDGHKQHDKVVAELVKRWTKTLAAGGDVWVKEGGQSDITAEAVRAIQRQSPEVDTTERIHVVQHSDWNEDQTTDAALEYTKKHTHYVRIPDANAYLNLQGGHDEFEAAARSHPTFGPAWRAAFAYYDPDERLDYSDTGELFYILGLGEVSIDDFVTEYLQSADGNAIKSADSDGKSDG